MDIIDGFPRREFKRSKRLYRYAVYTASVLVPALVVKAANAITPAVLWPGPAVILIAWSLMAGACLVILTKCLSVIDFEKPAVVIEPDGVTIAQSHATFLPWASILKVKFYDGNLNRSEIVVFEMVARRAEILQLSHIVGISTEDLLDVIKAYHRKFGPQPSAPAGGGPIYDSAAWTGLEDD